MLALDVGHVLGLDQGSLLSRTLGTPLAGGIALIAASWVVRRALPRALRVAADLLAFLAGYAATATGRGDFGVLLARRRPEADPGAGGPDRFPLAGYGVGVYADRSSRDR